MNVILCVIATVVTLVNGVCLENTGVFYRSPNVTSTVVCPVARDCKEWLNAGVTKSGVYPINPDGGIPFQVYCDMITDGGGWTVFQRRQDGTVDFLRNWVDYERGFGNLTGEFWLGLSKIHRLTPNGANTLRFDLKDFERNSAYAKFYEFEILDSYTQYTIYVNKYKGTAGDSLSFSNGMKFSTKDRDNDIDSGVCTARHPGAWWFKDCYRVHLNAEYIQGGTTSKWRGIIWNKWKGSYYSLKFTEMKVRRNN